MSKRVVWILLGTISMVFGLALYLLFRPYSYIAIALKNVPYIDILQKWASNYDCAFLRFYLGDFLWGFGLGCTLRAIDKFNKLGRIGVLCIVFLFGTLWEVLQLLGFIRGTGDVLDVVMYFIAGMGVIIIDIKERSF